MPVYIIRSASAVSETKIGFAKNARKRLKGLQTNHPYKLTIIRVLDGGRDAEAALHHRFRLLRLKGEWFTYHNEMMADLGFPDLPIPLPPAKRVPKPQKIKSEKLRGQRDWNSDWEHRGVISQTIGEWMSAAGMSEEGLAALLGVTVVTVTDWVRYGNRPQHKHRSKLREISGGVLNLPKWQPNGLTAPAPASAA